MLRPAVSSWKLTAPVAVDIVPTMPCCCRQCQVLVPRMQCCRGWTAVLEAVVDAAVTQTVLVSWLTCCPAVTRLVLDSVVIQMVLLACCWTLAESRCDAANIIIIIIIIIIKVIIIIITINNIYMVQIQKKCSKSAKSTITGCL